MSSDPYRLFEGARRSVLTRRTFLAGAASTLTACATTNSPGIEPAAYTTLTNRQDAANYAAVPDERFAIPAVDVTKVDPRYLRQTVAYARPERPGTLVVDPHARFLYLVMEGGRAMRYGIGVGRQGFEWSGRGVIQYKRAWPRWTPPDEMVARQPELEPYSIANGGMGSGLDNPLGARALYIFEDGRDTLYRLHGTNEPRSIGRAVSSGCIRLFNQDVIDLYNRTPNGTPVVVLDAGSPGPAV
jgi:lipoprotein-anchoring transpeptidase ErfK/SrfK